jgi:hypothetical protein
MRRIMEPTLMALRIDTQAEHRAQGLLWLSLGIAGLCRWEVAGARDALRHADLFAYTQVRLAGTTLRQPSACWTRWTPAGPATFLASRR